MVWSSHAIDIKYRRDRGKKKRRRKAGVSTAATEQEGGNGKGKSGSDTRGRVAAIEEIEAAVCSNSSGSDEEITATVCSGRLRGGEVGIEEGAGSEGRR
ncbi:hypothetical protein BHM03_00016860 [Ensete ventricosum]|nr:hypothetical protein BHM03_00016860 [Ensete ventricosum]